MIGFTELCNRLGVSRSRLTKWVKEGLPHEVHKRKKQFQPDSVREWLVENGHASPPSPPPAAVHTRNDCAQHFNVAVRTVAEWQTKVDFPGRAGSPGKRDGFYPLEEIAAWRAKTFGDETAGDNARDRLASIKASIAEIDLKERLGEVVEAADVERFMARTIAAVRSVIDQIPSELAAELPTSCDDATKAKFLLRAKEVINEAYSTLADLDNWQDEMAA